MNTKAKAKRVWAFCESEMGIDTPFLAETWGETIAPAAAQNLPRTPQAREVVASTAAL
jgi:hypothetical protein